MSNQQQQLLNAWLSDGGITEDVVELYGLAGREISNTKLGAAKDQTQEWLRAPGEQRWEMLDVDISDEGRFLELAEKLGLHSTWKRPEDNPTADLLVIPGATFRAMRHRLFYGLSEMRGVHQLIMLASHRPAREDELDALGNHRLVPGMAHLATEATMAQLLLAMGTYEDSMSLRSVIATVNRENGKPARTDETIRELVSYIGNGTRIAFGLHQPYALRQMLTIGRILRELEYDGETVFVAAEPLGPKDGMSFSVTGNYVARLLDEVCRCIYELEKLNVRTS